MRGVEAEAKFVFRMPERGAADGVKTVRRSFCCFFRPRKAVFLVFRPISLA